MHNFIVILFCIAVAEAVPYKPSPSRAVVTSNIQSRIINGQEASLGQFPWQAALYVNVAGTAYFCTGSIISEEWILTAAHCIADADFVDVYTGIVELPRAARALVRANETIVHEGYDPQLLENDIALLRVSTPLTFDNDTQPIALSSEQVHNNVNVTVSGWGSTTEAGALSRVLTYVTLSTITNGHCEELYGQLFDGALCAVSDNDVAKSPCNGDGGAPLVADISGDPVLVGIFIFVSGNGCESTDPSGYSRISYYRDWIKTRSGI